MIAGQLHRRESSGASFVVKQAQHLVARQGEVDEAIAIEVAPSGTHPPEAHLRKIFHQLERAVAAIPVKLTGRQFLIGQVKTAARRDEEQIVVAVVVEITERRAAAHVLGQLRRALAAKGLEPRQARGGGDIREPGLRRTSRELQLQRTRDRLIRFLRIVLIRAPAVIDDGHEQQAEATEP